MPLLATMRETLDASERSSAESDVYSARPSTNHRYRNFRFVPNRKGNIGSIKFRGQMHA